MRRTSATGKHPAAGLSRGLTLIETLAVLGILATMGILTLGLVGLYAEEDKWMDEQQRLLQFVREASILASERRSPLILTLQHGHWALREPGGELVREIPLPEGVRGMEPLDLMGQPRPEEGAISGPGHEFPATFFPNGRFTPFRLILNSSDRDEPLDFLW